MRTLLLVVAGLALSASVQAEQIARKTQSPSLAVRISIADPCMNSHYTNMPVCSGKVVQRTAESTQNLELRTVFNDRIPGADSYAYTVRVTDFY
jgi:hypothetical protein